MLKEAFTQSVGTPYFRLFTGSAMKRKGMYTEGQLYCRQTFNEEYISVVVSDQFLEKN
jgi:hypothetical protein